MKLHTNDRRGHRVSISKLIDFANHGQQVQVTFKQHGGKMFLGLSLNHKHIANQQQFLQEKTKNKNEKRKKKETKSSYRGGFWRELLVRG